MENSSKKTNDQMFSEEELREIALELTFRCPICENKTDPAECVSEKLSYEKFRIQVVEFLLVLNQDSPERLRARSIVRRLINEHALPSCFFYQLVQFVWSDLSMDSRESPYKRASEVMQDTLEALTALEARLKKVQKTLDIEDNSHKLGRLAGEMNPEIRSLLDLACQSIEGAIVIKTSQCDRLSLKRGDRQAPLVFKFLLYCALQKEHADRKYPSMPQISELLLVLHEAISGHKTSERMAKRYSADNLAKSTERIRNGENDQRLKQFFAKWDKVECAENEKPEFVPLEVFKKIMLMLNLYGLLEYEKNHDFSYMESSLNNG